MRKAASKHGPNHVHKKTPKKGLIRLGVWLEVEPKLWASFKRGSGKWDCCGEKWSRPEFKARSYFLITRGIQKHEFYEKVLADPYCANMQVSVDVLKDGSVFPDEEQLKWLAQFDKVIFRLKTTPDNVKTMDALAQRLGIKETFHVLETPLKSTKFRRFYCTATCRLTQ